MRVWKRLISLFLYFSFSILWFLLFVFSYSHLNCLQLDPFRILLQLPNPLLVEFAILINSFLFFTLKMTAFNDVETGSCFSEMLSMMSWRSSIISVLIKFVLQPVTFLFKSFNLDFSFFLSWFLVLVFSNLALDLLEFWVKVTKNNV